MRIYFIIKKQIFLIIILFVLIIFIILTKCIDEPFVNGVPYFIKVLLNKPKMWTKIYIWDIIYNIIIAFFTSFLFLALTNIIPSLLKRVNEIEKNKNKLKDIYINLIKVTNILNRARIEKGINIHTKEECPFFIHINNAPLFYKEKICKNDKEIISQPFKIYIEDALNEALNIIKSKNEELQKRIKINTELIDHLLQIETLTDFNRYKDGLSSINYGVITNKIFYGVLDKCNIEINYLKSLLKCKDEIKYIVIDKNEYYDIVKQIIMYPRTDFYINKPYKIKSTCDDLLYIIDNDRKFSIETIESVISKIVDAYACDKGSIRKYLKNIYVVIKRIFDVQNLDSMKRNLYFSNLMFIKYEMNCENKTDEISIYKEINNNKNTLYSYSLSIIINDMKYITENYQRFVNNEYFNSYFSCKYNDYANC